VAKAVVALHKGFDYQARWFWIEALRLLRSEPVLERVIIEAPNPRGFDDVVSHPVQHRDNDVWGRPVDIDGFQAKFHVDHSTLVRAVDLADPGFLLAKETSLLQRLRLAVSEAEARAQNGRFTLITPWHVDPADLLGRLLGTDGSLRLSVLFDGSGPRSATGRLRQAWREHLQLKDDDALQQLLRHLRIHQRDLAATDRQLELELDRAALALVAPDSVAHPYVDLINGHVKQQEFEFDAVSLRRTLTAAGLWRETSYPTDPRETLAIRSRRHGAVHLEDETRTLLDLIPMFHDRDLRAGVDWNGDVAASIANFVAARVQVGTSYRLYLDAHGAIAFTAGWLLHRADVTPMQLTSGRLAAWGSSGPTPEGPLWQEVLEPRSSSSGPDVAVALGVTHDVADDVRRYVARQLPGVSLLVVLTVPTVGPASVSDGAHANALAIEAVQKVQAARPRDGRPSRLHLFAAAPNGLMFQLGRNGRSLGPTTAYEFDFDNPHRGYAPAIAVPIQEETR